MVDRAPPEVVARDGGARPRHRGVRRAAGDPDRPGPAVHGVARDDRIRGRATPAGDSAHQEPAAAPDDRRQVRAVLEDALGRVPLAHRVRRLQRLHPAARALHRPLQLSEAAPGARRARAGRPILPRERGGARSDRVDGTGERAAARARTACEEAVLRRRTVRRPAADDLHGRGRPAGAGRSRNAGHDPARGADT